MTVTMIAQKNSRVTEGRIHDFGSRHFCSDLSFQVKIINENLYRLRWPFCAPIRSESFSDKNRQISKSRRPSGTCSIVALCSRCKQSSPTGYPSNILHQFIIYVRKVSLQNKSTRKRARNSSDLILHLTKTKIQNSDRSKPGPFSRNKTPSQINLTNFSWPKYSKLWPKMSSVWAVMCRQFDYWLHY